MQELTFITGNAKKAEYVAKWLDRPLAHHKLDLDELQSLDERVVVEHKARQAYKLLQRPVLVEDTSLTFHALGHLPGTLIKWFLEELKPEGLCKLLEPYEDRGATAMATFGLCDGKDVTFFQGAVEGRIAHTPRGAKAFGWDVVFIPEAHTKTFAEMTDEEMRPLNHRGRALEKLHEFLESPRENWR